MTAPLPHMLPKLAHCYVTTWDAEMNIKAVISANCQELRTNKHNLFMLCEGLRNIEHF